MSKIAEPQKILSDEELIEGMLAGESSAFEMTVALHHQRMLTIAKAIIGEAFAEEIVQDA